MQADQLSNSNSFQFQCIVNQNALPSGIKDTRNAVKKSFEKNPHKFIGKLLAYFTDKEQPAQGTAFFVGKGLLLTVAHNVSNFDNQPAKKVYFYPAQPLKQGMVRLQVKQFRIAKQYSFNNTKQYGPNVYDLALLELKQQNFYQIPDDYLRISYGFDLQNNRKAIIMAAGFPGEKNGPPDSYFMYEESSSLVGQDKNYIYYKHLTTGGQNGMPLFEIVNENQFNLIGIHKGIFQGFEIDVVANNKQKKRVQRPFGHAFNDSKKELVAEMAEDMQVEAKLGVNYEPSKARLLKHFQQTKNQIKMTAVKTGQVSENKNSPQKKYDSVYVNKLISNKKYSEAFKLAKEAVQKQCPAAYGDLARIYLYCDDANVVKEDNDKAFSLASKGAKCGEPNSITALGKCYLNGKGVNNNQQKGIEWITRAAEQDEQAQYESGRSNQNGDGVNNDGTIGTTYFSILPTIITVVPVIILVFISLIRK